MTHRLQSTVRGTLTNSRIYNPHNVVSRTTDTPKGVDHGSSVQHVRRVSSHAASPKTVEGLPRPPQRMSDPSTVPIGQIARQKEANREFFVNLLSSAATKRDAKAYISRLKSPSKPSPTTIKTQLPRPQVNLGKLFGKTRAAAQSPVFTQYEPEPNKLQERETIHVALVKLYDLDRIPDNVVVGIAETLCQLARLGMSPCVVLEHSGAIDGETRYQLESQADRLGTAIDAMSEHGARQVGGIFTLTEAGTIEVPLRKLLSVPLRRGLIPLVVPTAYSDDQQTVVCISADDAVLALTREFAKFDKPVIATPGAPLPERVALDRIIVIDHAGGIPSKSAVDGKHVFLNLEQEYTPITQDLSAIQNEASTRHLSNLKLLRQALKYLPHSASGLMATPEEAANMVPLQQESSPSLVGTRRQKNTLIHNLLTDKPAYSSSLPKGRLSKKAGTATPSSVATFVKHGMLLTMLPDPTIQPWTSNGPRIKLTDSQIDLDRLVYLIDDSFNRSLDIDDYLKRVNDRVAGVIIAGDYEGGAILTWEPPPGVDVSDTDRLVPYLDKFAVLKRSQGAGGVADIVFNAMVRTCFPGGVCWRSRKNNPVNKWYFERSRGTKKIPDMNWTMFWTTPGVAEDSQKFQDYEGVCRGVVPSWLDKKMAAD